MPGEQSLYLFFVLLQQIISTTMSKNYDYQQLCQNESLVGTPPPEKNKKTKRLPVISIPRIPVLE